MLFRPQKLPTLKPIAKARLPRSRYRSISQIPLMSLTAKAKNIATNVRVIKCTSGQFSSPRYRPSTSGALCTRLVLPPPLPRFTLEGIPHSPHPMARVRPDQQQSRSQPSNNSHVAIQTRNSRETPQALELVCYTKGMEKVVVFECLISDTSPWKNGLQICHQKLHHVLRYKKSHLPNCPK